MNETNILVCATGKARQLWLSAVEAAAPKARVTVFDSGTDLLDRAVGGESAAIVLEVDDFPMLHDPLVSRIREVHAPSPVVVSSAWFPIDGLDIARATGIAACVPRHYSDQQRQLALSLVLSGAGHYPTDFSPRPDLPEPTTTTATEFDTRYTGPEVLTPRQRDVAVWLVRGKTNLEISKLLDLGEQVVKNHVTEIFRRIHVDNRAQAVDVLRRMEEIRHRQESVSTEERQVLHWLERHMRHVQLDAGKVLFHKGDAGSDLFYIQSGIIALEEIEEEMGPKEIFGEIGAFTAKHRRTCTARAKTMVNLFRLDYKHVRRLFFDYPEFALHVVSVLAQRVASGRGL